MDKNKIINFLQSKKEEIDNKKIKKAQNEGKIESALKSIKDKIGVEDLKKAKSVVEGNNKKLEKIDKQIETRYNDLVEDYGGE